MLTALASGLASGGIVGILIVAVVLIILAIIF